MALVALICDLPTLVWPYWMWKELISSRPLTKVHAGSLWSLYLNVLTNQITLYDDIKIACVFFFKSLIRQPTFFGIFLYQRVWLYILKAFKAATCWSACYPRSFRIRGSYCWKRNTAVICFYVQLFECVRALKIKSSTMQHDRKKKSELPNHMTSTAHAQIFMETTSFCMMYFYISTHNSSQDDELFSGN